MSKTRNKFSPEVRGRVVRVVGDEVYQAGGRADQQTQTHQALDVWTNWN